MVTEDKLLVALDNMSRANTTDVFPYLYAMYTSIACMPKEQVIGAYHSFQSFRLSHHAKMDRAQRQYILDLMKACCKRMKAIVHETSPAMRESVHESFKDAVGDTIFYY